MIISETDAIWGADKFIDYFKNFKTIEDYLRNAKNEAIGKRTTMIFGCSHKDEFLNEDIHPSEMEFEVKFVGDRFDDNITQKQYLEYLTATSSHVIEHNIPGRELRWMVFEKRTQKIMGFIRFGSPVINSNLEIFGLVNNQIFLGLIVMRLWDLLLSLHSRLDIIIWVENYMLLYVFLTLLGKN